MSDANDLPQPIKLEEVAPEDVQFQSRIPDHLLRNASEQDVYILKTLNINEQQNAWLIKAMIKTSSDIHTMNTRLVNVETWKSKITSYKALFVYAVICLVGLINVLPSTFKIIDRLNGSYNSPQLSTTGPTTVNIPNPASTIRKTP